MRRAEFARHAGRQVERQQLVIRMVERDQYHVARARLGQDLRAVFAIGKTVQRQLATFAFHALRRASANDTANASRHFQPVTTVSWMLLDGVQVFLCMGITERIRQLTG
jgi:hypothetical protein